MNAIHRRQFIKQFGISAVSLPFIIGLPSLGLASPARPRQRLIIMFSPNGTIPSAFWPEETGKDFTLKEIMSPLDPFKERMLILHGLANKVRGDGDGHMRGMSCLLTGIELFPGNVQGGSDTPAGWASGISIDQELKNFFQSREDTRQKLRIGPPQLEEGVADQNDNVPRLSRMQIDLLVNGFVNDMARVATLQYTKSVGQAQMSWLGIKDNHHSLSHEPDKDEVAQAKLVKINKWFCGELRYLVEKLANTPEPGDKGCLLDHTLVVWTNELGKGNSHTLDNIPFVLIGGGFGFEMGRALKFEKTPHNRLHLALAHAVGHRIETFGKSALSEGGPLSLS